MKIKLKQFEGKSAIVQIVENVVKSSSKGSLRKC